MVPVCSDVLMLVTTAARQHQLPGPLHQRVVMVFPGAAFMISLYFSKGDQVKQRTGHCPDLLL